MWPSEWQIDHDALIDAGGRLQKIKMYPYVDTVHYIVSCMAVRDDLGPTSVSFSRKHPFSCWLSCMLISFAGSLLSCFLLGEPVITPFKKHEDIILATIVWYFVFYSPFDVVYKLAKLYPIKVVLSVIKEVQRAFKISQGVTYAAKLYPTSYLVQFLVGVAKGAGGGAVKIVEQLVRGSWIPNHHEFLRPTFTTKACVLASIIFTLERNSVYVTAPHDLVYLCVVGFFVYFKLSALLFSVTDALAPLENLFCAVFMGGIWDALTRAVEATKEEANAGKTKLEEDLLDTEKKKKKLDTKKNK